MAYTYIHIVENYFVKPSRAGYVLGTLQTKKGGQRKLMNGVTYGSLAHRGHGSCCPQRDS